MFRSPGGACVAPAEEGDRHPSRWVTAHPKGNHRDPVLRGPY